MHREQMEARCLQRQEKENAMQDPTQTKWEGRWDQFKGQGQAGLGRLDR